VTDVEVQQQGAQVQTPVTAEDAIDFCIRQIRRAPDIIKDRLEKYQALKHALDIKMAQVADDTDGSEAAKKRAAILACVEEQKNANTAYEALQYAKVRARAYEKELSGLQSVNKSVDTAYRTSGWRS
jgi:hypothetical protein